MVQPKARSVRHGELEVFGAVGQLDVLAVGRGHLRLTVPEGDAIEQEKARRIIEDMLRRGYAIFVETDDGGTERVRGFDPERFAYLIDDTMDVTRAEDAPPHVRDVHLPPAEGENKCSECGRAFPKRGGPGAQPKTCPDCKASKKAGRPLRGVPVDRARATAVGRVAGG